MDLRARLFAPLLVPLIGGCASTLYIPTTAPQDPTPKVYDDPVEATRVSGVRDLVCARAVDAYRISYHPRGLGGRSAAPPAIDFDIAEGCGKRATYLEDCKRMRPMPPGLSAEEAAHRKRWTVADVDERAPLACKLTLVGVVPLDPSVAAAL
jgi:hypothetical protein